MLPRPSIRTAANRGGGRSDSSWVEVSRLRTRESLQLAGTLASGTRVAGRIDWKGVAAGRRPGGRDRGTQVVGAKTLAGKPVSVGHGSSASPGSP